MRYRTIAGTDVTVSELGFGVWTLATTWWGDHSDASAISLLRTAFDHGVTLFDTADTYGKGRGETLLRDAFSPAERDRIVIATKFGYDWRRRPDTDLAGHQEAPHCWEPAFIQNALEDSLRRLGTDVIDVWQMHNPRMDALHNDDVWTVLDKAKRAGKIRAVGVALGPAIGWLAEGVSCMRHHPVDVVQIIYNALELDPGRGLIQAARETNTSLMVRVPHSSGMLEGKYTEDTVFDENDHRRHRPRAWLINGLQKIRQLDFLTPPGVTLGQAALRFILHAPEVVTNLPNIYNQEQLEEFLGASDAPDLTDAQYQRVVALYDDNFGLDREREHGLNPEAGMPARQEARSR